jgi:hypothetical protein
VVSNADADAAKDENDVEVVNVNDGTGSLTQDEYAQYLERIQAIAGSEGAVFARDCDLGLRAHTRGLALRLQGEAVRPPDAGRNLPAPADGAAAGGDVARQRRDDGWHGSRVGSE